MPDDEKILVLPLGEESKIITQTIANDTARKILELLADSPMSTSAIAKKLDIPLTTAQYNIEKLMEAGLVVVEKTKYSEKGREVKLYTPARRMIVLVPKNTPGQAVLDALKKYLVLLPIAALVSLFIETAMFVRNKTGPVGEILTNAGNFGFSASKSASEAANESFLRASSDSTNPLPAPYVQQANDSYGIVSGTVTGHNTTTGLTGPATSIENTGAVNDTITQNMTSAAGNLNASWTGAAAPPQPAPGATLSITDQIVQSVSSFDLLSHYGLWFFVGCLLIICLLAGYDLYNRRKKMK